MNKAIFLDKDGTLIKDVPYNVDPELIVLSPNCIKGLKLLQQQGYKLVIISNQSGVARGFFTEAALKNIEIKLRQLLSDYGLNLDGFYYCPHHPEGTIAQYSINCTCRKPMPGMFFQAAGQLDIDLKESWMIGDILNDVEAGNRAGCCTILIDNGNETEWIVNLARIPQKVCNNINGAAQYILSKINHDGQLEQL